jgi:hypothetical protein
VKSNMMMIAAIAALVAVPGCGSSSPPTSRSATATAGTPEDVARAAPYRISGAALMMTPAEVAAVLQGAGYIVSDKIGEAETMPSFEDQVKERMTGRSEQHPTLVPSVQTWRKGRESVRVTYGIYPGAPRAVHFTWSTDAPSPTDAEILATLEKRYGPGWRLKSFLSPSWCSPRPCGPKSATLDPGHSSIELTAPSSLYDGQANGKRIEAAAAARQGGKQGSF